MNNSKVSNNLPENLIVVENITKKYNKFTAIENVSFSIKKGEIIGFLGPNGAGKTTTMNILSGYISSTDGAVKIAGYDIFSESESAKKCIGYLPERPPLYDYMTISEYLQFVCDLKKIKSPSKEIIRVCELCKISQYKNKLIGQLSKGYRQRVGIAQALLGNPPVLILDEPTSGLDPSQIVQTRDLIKSLSNDHTVILSTHILSEIQAICDRIIIINNGKIIANDTEENILKNNITDNEYCLKLSCNSKDMLQKSLEKISKIVKLKSISLINKNIIEIKLASKVKKQINLDISKAFMENNIPILYFKDSSSTLEQVFINLIESKSNLKNYENNQSNKRENQI